VTSKLPPGPKKSIRTSMKWFREPAAIMQEGYERYGDVWLLSMQRGTSFVLVSEPDLIKQIFTADPAVLRGGEANAQIGTALMGKHSVILLDEDEHTASRNLLLPPFHRDSIQRFSEHVARACEENLASWPLHTPIELLPRMQEITLDTIMAAVFGVTGPTVERLRARITDLVAFGADERRMVLMHVAQRAGRVPRSFVRVRDPLDTVLFEVIEAARRDPRLDERDDVLAMLLGTRHEDGTPLADRELRDILVTLLMQGHMSTGTALAWALERLTRHPAMLERLRAELESGGEEYLDAVINEVLRLRPPVGLAMRMVKQPYEIGGYEVQPGMLLAPCILMLHRREDIYPSPLEFQPERFLDKPTGTYTWIPFGGGQRHCIGRSFATMEIKVVLRTLALQARFAPSEQPDEAITRRGIMFSPKQNALAVLRERVPAKSSVAA
jgi:cytochrome P450 family 135